MKSLSKLLMATILMFSASNLSAECNHNTYKSNNFMIPVGRVVFNPELENSNFAFSGLGEIGVRNYRASATAGVWTTERTRLKITSEYLTQKLNWNFTTGTVNHWVHQGAGGFDWQYLLDDCSVFQAIDAKGYYSYSQSKNVHDGICQLNFQAAPQSIPRHLAGANAMGGSINTVMVFGESHRFDVSLDYDYVKYRKNFASDKKVQGFGGSFLWLTRLPCCMDFALEGQFRRPFNYLGARLTLPRENAFGNTAVTLFGGLTRGKYSLPYSVKVGVEFVYDFALGNSCCNIKVRETCCALLWNPCDLNAWTLIPAVYMPEVLVIADECRGGYVDITSTPINAPDYVTGNFYSLDISGNFTSTSPLIFSAVGLAPGLTIDSTTGVISGVIEIFDVFDITVTASSGCSNVSEAFTLYPATE